MSCRHSALLVWANLTDLFNLLLSVAQRFYFLFVRKVYLLFAKNNWSTCKTCYLPLRNSQVLQSGCRWRYWSLWLKIRWRTKRYRKGRRSDCQRAWCLIKKFDSTLTQADLLCWCGAQILVSLQETFAESSFVRHRLYSGERHLTLVPNRKLLQYS